MSTTPARLTAAVAAGLLTVGLATTPATAMRLVPVDSPGTTITDEPAEDTSLLLSMGRIAAYTGTPAESTVEMLMSIGRLPR